MEDHLSVAMVSTVGRSCLSVISGPQATWEVVCPTAPPLHCTPPQPPPLHTSTSTTLPPPLLCAPPHHCSTHREDVDTEEASHPVEVVLVPGHRHHLGG